MADKNTIEKVKELLEVNVSAPLKEAAEKWLAAADEKYDVKDKAARAKDKLDDAVDAVKDKAEPYLDKIQDKAAPAIDKISDMEFVKQLKDSISTFADNIELFGSDKGAEIVGSREAAEQIKKHAEAMRAEGKTYCDCPACTKAREILKDLGEELED